MSSEHKMGDVKLQRIQNILGKATCPLLYLLDLFVEKSSKNEGMSKEELNRQHNYVKMSTNWFK